MKKMLRSNLAKKIFSALLLTVFFLPLFVHAAGSDDILNNLNSTGLGSGSSSNTDLPKIIGSIIKLVLGFLGIILVILIIWAGFKWMTAGGDSKKVDDAKKVIVNAVIGTVIILAAYIITVFVISKATTAVNGGGI